VYYIRHPPLRKRLVQVTSRGTDRSASVSSSAPARRPLVLVIDDERSVRMALTRYFERGGWEVRQAEDGSEALELLESQLRQRCRRVRRPDPVRLGRRSLPAPICHGRVTPREPDLN